MVISTSFGNEKKNFLYWDDFPWMRRGFLCLACVAGRIIWEEAEIATSANDDHLNRNTEGRKFLYSQGTQRRSASASRSNTIHQAVTGNRNTNSHLVYAQHQAKLNSKPQETKYVKVIEEGVYVIKAHLNSSILV